MRDCVGHKVKGMLSKQTGGQVNFSVSVKAAACRGFETSIQRDGRAGFRQPRINPDEAGPGFGHGFGGQCEECFLIHAVFSSSASQVAIGENT